MSMIPITAKKRKSISTLTSMYVFRAHYSKESTTKVLLLFLLKYFGSLYVEIRDGASFQAEPSGEISESAIVSIAKEETKPNSKKKRNKPTELYF